MEMTNDEAVIQDRQNPMVYQNRSHQQHPLGRQRRLVVGEDITIASASTLVVVRKYYDPVVEKIVEKITEKEKRWNECHLCDANVSCALH